MAETFTLQIVTPERVVIEREVIAFVAPAYDGYLGVMAHHAPLVAELKVGAIAVTAADGEQDGLAVTGGILTVSGNQAIVLADAAELAQEIDVERAEQAEARARDRLGRLAVGDGEEPVDPDRARAALMRAINRLKVARKRP